jgi:hypothetical protein
VLLGKALETGDTVDDLVKKLTDQARKAEVSAQADRVFSKTQAGLAVRVRETTDALNSQNASLRTNAQLRNVEARQEVAEAEKNVQKANDRVAAARRNAQAALQQGGTRGDVSAERAIAASAKATKDLQEAQRTAREANIDLNRSRVYLAAENAAADATEAGRIGRIYDDRINAVKRAAVAEASAGKQVGRATQDRILALEREKAAAIDAAGARARAAGGDTRSSGGRRARATPLGASTAEVMTASDLLATLNRELTESTNRLDRLFITGREYTQNAQRQFRDVFGQEGEDYTGPFADVEGYDRERDVRFRAAEEAERAAQDMREDNVRDLADLYGDLFTRSTDDVWRNFKEQGLRNIALVLAQATVASFGQGGGGFGSLLGNIASAAGPIFGGGPQGNPAGVLSIFGRASGGYVAPGQTVRVNEGTGRTELLRMGGQGGTVIPLGQTRAAQRTQATTVLQTIQVDARGAVMNDAFARDILSRAGQDARQVVTANNSAIRKSLPSAQDRYAKLGTTG